MKDILVFLACIFVGGLRDEPCESGRVARGKKVDREDKQEPRFIDGVLFRLSLLISEKNPDDSWPISLHFLRVHIQSVHVHFSEVLIFLRGRFCVSLFRKQPPSVLSHWAQGRRRRAGGCPSFSLKRTFCESSPHLSFSLS